MTATAKGVRKSKTGAAHPVAQIQVMFQSISIGDATCSIGFRIDREKMNLDAADELLCGHRITGRLIAAKEGDDPSQTTMFEADKYEVAGVFDSKKFGVTPRHITARATFSLADVDVEEIAHFAKRNGFIIAELVQQVDEEPPVEDEEEEDEE